MKINISAREQEVLHLIAYEHNSREIAQQLYISEHTVLTHRKNLITKLDVRNSAGLIRRAFEIGILKLNAVALFFLWMSPMFLFAQNIIYVDHQANGAANGTTWSSAYLTLHEALDQASYGDSIFVSEGTYTPPDTGRSSSFLIKDGLTLVGGFDPHNGIDDFTDISSTYSNKVNLSGDIGIEDDSSDNCYHVIKDISPGALSSGSRLYGLHIIDGHANHTTDDDHSYGGGIYIEDGRIELTASSISFCSARSGGSAIYATGSTLSLTGISVLDNFGDENNSCIGTVHLDSSIFQSQENLFIRNSSHTGGAIYALDSEINMIDNDFGNNTASSNGGALAIAGGTKSVIHQSRFYENTALTGGGVYTSSDSLTTISNTLITINEASNRGGGIYLTGGAQVELINANINYNQSSLDQGGGIYNSQSSCSIYNSIICCNNPDVAHGVSQNYHTFSPTLSEIGHSYIEYSGGSTNWSVSNTTDLSGNIDIDPMFGWTTFSDTIRQNIDCSSPFIDQGDSSYNIFNNDYGNEPRIVQTTIDIGAQEYQYDETELNWTGSGDGVNWDDPANWSCPRIPNQLDMVTLEVSGDTIVIDTGVIASALEVLLKNNCTLMVKGDTSLQSYGSLTTSKIELSEEQESVEMNLKNSVAQDSAYFINQGITTIVSDGIRCYDYCLISNDHELTINGEGVILKPYNNFNNSGKLHLNVVSDPGLKVASDRMVIGGGQEIVHYKSNKKQTSHHTTFYNLPTGVVNITGTTTTLSAQSFEIGIDIPIGQFLNEGVINMRHLGQAIVTGFDNTISAIKLKNNSAPTFLNEGIINIKDSNNGIIGKGNSRIENNGIVNGLNIRLCPLEFNVGFEFYNYGEIEMKD